MTTNLENNTISRVGSLEFQDSNKKVNRNGKSSTPALMKSKRGILSETNNPIKQTQLTCPLTKPNNAVPRIDIDSLAQQWCQLLMDQVQEERSRVPLRSAFGE